MNTLAEELLAYLGRKGCAINLRRIVEDFRRPQQEIEANLDQLRRSGLVQILRPGEWEIKPVRAAAAEVIPPFEPSAIARAAPSPQPAVITDVQEKTMPKGTKTCSKCNLSKGVTGFPRGGGDVCRLCTKGRKPKLQGGGSAPEEENERCGAFSARDPREARQAQRCRSLRWCTRAAARRSGQDRRGDRAA